MAVLLLCRKSVKWQQLSDKGGKVKMTNYGLRFLRYHEIIYFAILEGIEGQN